ncbi:xanthine dehydrogenase molybdopterin binding subunit [Microscilla marina]|uniref:Xanthine dehydrogenase/oxidase n=1 Tax=Microscilla marina ATCC 23134 TaxID=313606 RepID=A1ZVS9_MICM2|nr:molybdopterin cofactor-binding domain-containing protein [Microscilla marina]EAY25506.1 xanthine dehydrogenase/oxidase [Microscilla marina ATCC 23134]
MKQEQTHKSLKNIDSHGHVRGESIYVDDIAVQQGTLYGAVYDAPVAHGHLKHINVRKAKALPGVVAVFTAADVPGENQIGGIIPDEPLFADKEVHFWGQPIAFVVAQTEDIAREAAQLIEAEITPLPVITDPREAKEKGELIAPPRTFVLGDTATAWQACPHVYSGQASTNGQEHLYIETQGAYACPAENGNIKIHSSTQGPTAVQKTAARVLGLPMHAIEVDVTRLGGGFGGKEDQATPWAVMVALAVYHLKRPVKYILHRMDDMRMTGKRNPYTSDFKIGLDANLKIIAYEATFYQNAGAAADLSPAVLERTLFHCTNSYYVPNVTATAYSCRTNLPPNTAFRGFGGPQGMFVIEAAIAKAAQALGVPAADIQQKNLLQAGDSFPYGQKAENPEAVSSWSAATRKYALDHIAQQTNAFNAVNAHYKKGYALMPICFGISFTKTLMNQARALVHIYHDGSVGVSTGAVEMGQGVNTKMLQVAAQVFSIANERIKLETTNTTRVANTSPSAASATADLNGKALEIACRKLLERLKVVAAEELAIANVTDVTINNGWVHAKGQKTELDWNTLVLQAFLKRVSLSEVGHYATPRIHFDQSKEKGHPFAYHVYGTAITEVTVDCIRGTYEFDAVKIVHDFGASMNTIVDKGQIEGGLVQGIGWMTLEELEYNKQGKLLSNALSTYKVPDIYSVPKDIQVEFLAAEGSNLAIFKSKAVGEPPLMYGIGAYFAILNAVRAFNPQVTPAFDAPFTPEKVLTALYE